MSYFGIPLADILALFGFLATWFAYSAAVDFKGEQNHNLTAGVAKYRVLWMKEMAGREVRILDTQINGLLQTGASFFASTSLFAIGGSLALLGATEKVFDLFADLPMFIRPTRLLWEVKVFGLVIIFIYAFFKFAWSIRLFNYCGILIGATPTTKRDGQASPEALKIGERAAKMNIIAARQFNQGQRAFFFALGYLGWFLHPLVLCSTTLCIVYIMWRRQFRSEAVKILR